MVAVWAVFLLCVPMVLAQTPPAAVTLNVTVNGQPRTLNLYQRPVRATNFLLLTWTSANGYQTNATPPPVRTYRGTVAQEPNTLVCAVLKPGGLLSAAAFDYEKGKTYHWTLSNVDVSGQLPAGAALPEGQGTASVLAEEAGEAEIAHIPDGCANCQSAAPPVPEPAPEAAAAAEVPGIEAAALPPSTYMPPAGGMQLMDLALDITHYRYQTTYGGNLDLTLANCEHEVNIHNLMMARDALIAVQVPVIVVRQDIFYTTTNGGAQLAAMNTEWKKQPLFSLPWDQVYSYRPEGGLGAGIGGIAYQNNIGKNQSPMCIEALYHEAGHNWDVVHLVYGKDTMGGNQPNHGPFSMDRLLRKRNEAMTQGHLVPHPGPYPDPLPPYTHLDLASTLPGTPVDINVLANDWDGNGDAISIFAFSTNTARGGTVTALGGGGLRYTPAPGYVGKDVFAYTVQDSTGLKTRELVQVEVVNRGLAAHYTFDQTNGVSALDATGFGHHGALQGAANFATHREPGVLGGALRLDGGGVICDKTPLVPPDVTVTGNWPFDADGLARGNFFDPMDESYTVAFWFNAKDTATTRTLLQKQWHDEQKVGFKLTVSASGLTATVRQFNGLSSTKTLNGSAAITAGRWHHVALQFDRSAELARLFLNGVQIASDSLDAGRFIYQGRQPLLLGPDAAGQVVVDDFRLYTKALTPAELVGLYELAGPGQPRYLTDPVVMATAYAGLPYQWDAAQFLWDGGIPLTFSVSNAPAWLTLSGNVLSGTPGPGNGGTFSFTVTATATNGLLTSATHQVTVLTNVIVSVANGSWTNGATWSDGLDPAAGKDYLVDGETVSAANTNTTQSFPGRSLTVKAGALRLPLEHNSTGWIATYNLTNLALDGGTLQFDASNGTSTWNVNRPVTVLSPSALLQTDGNYSYNCNLNGGLTGPGDVSFTVNRSDTDDINSFLNVFGNNTNFTGNWTVSSQDSGGAAQLVAKAANALGLGVVTLNTGGRLVNGVAGGLNSLAAVNLLDASARLVLTFPWVNASARLTATEGATVELGAGASTVASLVVDYNSVPPGTYTAAQLAAFGLTASGSGTLQVLALAPLPPVFNANPLVLASVNEGVAYSNSLAGLVTDPNPGDVLTFTKLSGPAWLNVATNGVVSGTPLEPDAGLNQWVVRVTDSTGLWDETTVQLFVIPFNDPPVFTSNPVLAPPAFVNAAYGASLAGFATDPDPGDILTFGKLGGPAWLSVAGDGALLGTPTAAHLGTNEFTVFVRDLGGLSNTATLRIVVQPPAATVVSVANGLWNAGTTWSNGQPPASTNAYRVLHQVQSPDDNDHTFGGNSMSVTNGGTLYLYRSNNGTSLNVVHRVPFLTLQHGAVVRFRSSNGSLQHLLPERVTIAGSITFSSTDTSYDNNLTLSGGVSGAGTVNYSVNRNAGGERQNLLVVSATSPDYSGDWVVDYLNAGDDYAILDAAAADALGTGTVTLKHRSWLRSLAAGALDSLSGVVLATNSAQLILTHPWNNPAATLTSVLNATVNLGAGTNRIGALVIAGTPVANGSYTAAQLTALGLNASGTGLLLINPEPTTPPALTATVSGGVLTVSWPLDYTSYQLYAQTNPRNVGLSTNWVPVPGVVSNSLSAPLNPALPAVFYRLQKP